MPLEQHFSLGEILLRLGVAALLGMLLGLERELKNKSAGLRTQMLICMGAAATTIVSIELHFALLADTAEPLNADPLRAIEGVIAAIGFLGAGAIIQSRGDVQGMTTAATIWLGGVIGMACGGGFYLIALVAYFFTFLIVAGLYVVERRFVRPAATATDEPKE